MSFSQFDQLIAIDFALLFVAVKLCKILTTTLTHVIDVDFDNLIKDTAFFVVLATIQREANLVKAT